MKRTPALLQLAAALCAAPDNPHWGYQMQKQTGLRSGVLYPLLQRMLDEGWLTDGWEDVPDNGRRQRPPRRYYRLTEDGLRELGALPAPTGHHYQPTGTRVAYGGAAP